MRLRVPVVVVALAVSVFAASCDSSVVQLRTETMGDTIEVTEDQTIELILEDNPRFDNANWEWIVVESGVVEHVSTDQVTRPDDEGVARTWTLAFTPVRIGTAELTLVYRQPDHADVEPDVEGVLSTFTITVTVTGTSNGSESQLISPAHIGTYALSGAARAPAKTAQIADIAGYALAGVGRKPLPKILVLIEPSW